MNALLLARSVAAGRIGFGLGLVVAPGLITSRWLGKDARRAGTKVGARGLGARDLALGIGALTAPPSEVRRWIALALAGDAADLLATLAAGDDLPLQGRIIVSGLAAGGVAVSAVALAGLGSDD